ncbi:hypothetical protein Emag_004125 [Eimeria magna]
MTVSRLLVYTAATLVLVDWTLAASAGTITATLSQQHESSLQTDASECLVEMDAVREAAGLTPLAKSKKAKLPSDPQHELWKLVCDALLEVGSFLKLSPGFTWRSGSPFQLTLWRANWCLRCFLLRGQKEIGTYEDRELPRGNYALFELDGATSPQCNAAVTDWRSALNMFPRESPPSKEDVIFRGREGLAFVALYNPSDGAVGECQVVACTEKLAEMQLQAQAAGPTVPIERRESDLTSKTVSAVFCSTFPDAFDSTPLFT